MAWVKTAAETVKKASKLIDPPVKSTEFLDRIKKIEEVKLDI